MNEIIRAMIERRSVRSYKNEMLPKAVIDDIIEAGLYAASGRGYQSAIIVVQLGKIKHIELERELEVCSMCGIDINGVVAIV